ncbi:uncharacterized protein ACB058_001254 [Synchiropus picturatus]
MTLTDICESRESSCSASDTTVEAEFEVEWTLLTPSSKPPSRRHVVRTFKNAAANPGPSKITIIPNSIKVTEGPDEEPGNTLAPPPAYTAICSLQEPFTKELNDPSSTEFKDLEAKLASWCEHATREKCGNKNGHCKLRKLRKSQCASSETTVEAELEVQLPWLTPTSEAPSGKHIAGALKRAAENSARFQVTIISSSVEVTASHVEDSPTETEAPSGPPLVYTVTSTIDEEAFTDELNDPSSRKYKDLEEELLSWCECASSEKCGNTISNCRLIKFRESSCSASDTTVEAEFEVEWTLLTPSSKPPSRRHVVRTFKNAAANPGPSKITIIPNSIKVTEGPVEEPGNTLAPPPAYTAICSLQEPFTKELNDQSSTEFKDLETKLVRWCEHATREKCGNKNGHCKLRKLRKSQCASSETTVEAELEVQLPWLTPTSEAPSGKHIAGALKRAAENSGRFQVTIISSSVQVTASHVEDSPTEPEAPSGPPLVYTVTSTIDEEAFTDELNDPSSRKYKDLEEELLSWCECASSEKCGNTISHCRLIKFRESSCSASDTTVEAEFEVEWTLLTPSSKPPSRRHVVKTFKNAAANPEHSKITIIPNSIKVTEGPDEEPGNTWAPPPAYTAICSLQEPFTKELNDPSSTEFKDLEAKLVRWCERATKEKCGNKNGHCKLRKLRKSQCASSETTVEAELEVQLPWLTPTSEAPSGKHIAGALKRAAENSGRFQVTIISSSVQVTASHVEDSPTEPEAPSGPPLVYTVTSTIDEEAFTDELNDPSSRKYKDLEEELLSWCECASSEKCGNTISHCRLIKFRESSCSASDTTVEAEFEVEWTLLTPSSKPPSRRHVVRTFKNAAANPGHSKITIIPNSIKVTEGPDEEPGNTLAPPPAYTAICSLQEPFTKELNDPSSTEFKDLEAKLVRWCEHATKEKCGDKNGHCKLRKLRKSQCASSETTVEAELEVQLPWLTPTSEAPSGKHIAGALKRAAENSARFQVTIISSSVQVTASHVEDSPTEPEAPSGPPLVYTVTSTIDEEAFTDELNDPSSRKYKDLEEELLSWCECASNERCGNTISHCRLIKFRESSCSASVTTVEAEFEVEWTLLTPSSKPPSRRHVVRTFKNAAANPGHSKITIIPNSIKVTVGHVDEPITPSGPPLVYTVTSVIDEEPFTEELNDPSSRKYKDLEEKVLHWCESVTKQYLDIEHVVCKLQKFRNPSSTSLATGVEAEFDIEFITPTSPKIFLTSKEVQDSFRKASMKPANSQIYTIPDSVQVKDPAKDSPTEPEAPSGPPLVYTVTSTIDEEAFTDELNDPSSRKYKELEEKLLSWCETAVKQSLVIESVGCKLKAFRQPSSTQKDSAVEVEFDIQFSSSPTKHPSRTELADALGKAAETSGINILPHSLQTAVGLVEDPTTVPSSEPVYVVRFWLRDETYSSDLSNSNSLRYKSLAQDLIEWCQQINRRKYMGQFDRCTIRGFRRFTLKSQSNMVEAEFGVHFRTNTTDFPQNGMVERNFWNNSQISDIPVIASSFTVIESPVMDRTTAQAVPKSTLPHPSANATPANKNSTIVSNGVRHKLSLVTALCLVTLSSLLSGH